MDRLKAFVSCKVTFTCKSYEANQPVCLHVYLLSECVQDIEFSQLSVQFTNPIYNGHCCLNDPKRLILRPNKIARLTFDLVADQQDTGREVGVTTFSLSMAGPGLTMRLRWRADASATAIENPFHSDVYSAESPPATDWAELRQRPFTRIVPKAAQVSVNVTHESPALVNEFYRVTLALKNNEPTRIFNCRLSLALVPHQAASKKSEAAKTDPAQQPQSPPPPPPPLPPPTPLQQQQPSEARGFHMTCEPVAAAPGSASVDHLTDLDLGGIEVNSTVARTFYFQIFQPGEKEINIAIMYETEVPVLGRAVVCSASLTDSFTVSCIAPFEVLSEVQSMSFIPTPSVSVRDPFVLSVTTRSQAPWPIDIAGSELLLNQHVKVAEVEQAGSTSDSDSLESQLAGLTVRDSECLTECWVLTADTARSQNFRLGSYVVRWRRRTAPSSAAAAGGAGEDPASACGLGSDEQLPIVSTTVSLPAVNLYNLPLSVTLRLPPIGTVYQPVMLAYGLENRTSYPQEVQFTVERSEYFMFSGLKSVSFRILPQTSHTLEYCAYPLATGLLDLPRIGIRLDGTEVPVYSLLKDLPARLFVAPPGRTGGQPNSAPTVVCNGSDTNASLVEV